MIEEIIQREWEFLQETQNIDGRASCQDNFELFHLYRKSQFMTFTKELLENYLQDMKDYKRIGLNPISLKYAYMMESNDPQGYANIEQYVPKVNQETNGIIEEIVAIELTMMEQFEKLYPAISYASRNTYSSSDSEDETSFETYLRGELKTYSKKTLVSYAYMVLDASSQDKNLVLLIRENTVKMYGYQSLEQAEEKLK
ncbi:DUF4125 family protein [Tannockella kyphosi]|uniref:DUF4125 family protein n=1 Tax=Tannockella kyphosi TaxID=2899121 RepID=UPI002011DE8F|nr:DUF4125 family protein [Tannockella kyphosi]